MSDSMPSHPPAPKTICISSEGMAAIAPETSVDVGAPTDQRLVEAGQVPQGFTTRLMSLMQVEAKCLVAV